MCIDQQSKKDKFLCYKERNTDRFLIELMCIDQQSKKKPSIYVTKKGIQTDFNRTHVYRPTI